MTQNHINLCIRRYVKETNIVTTKGLNRYIRKVKRSILERRIERMELEVQHDIFVNSARVCSKILKEIRC